MWTLELLLSGVFKVGSLAARGIGTLASRAGRSVVDEYGTGEGVEAVVNAIGNLGEKVVSNTARVGGAAYRAIMTDYVGPAADAAIKTTSKVMIKDPSSPFGVRMHPFMGEVAFLGIMGAAVPSGARQAQMGLVNYGPAMQSTTGAAMSPNVVQGVGVSRIDDLGATGDLALALHNLRRG